MHTSILCQKYNSYILWMRIVFNGMGGHAMKQILLKSVYDAFEYVMDHYYPFGLEELAQRNDSYAVISIQDTHTEGFGFRFAESQSCRDVLTLYFDDIEHTVEGAVLFDEIMAEEILSFVKRNRNLDTLLVHCYGGESRSRAVAAFVSQMFGMDGKVYFETGNPNLHVYRTLREVYLKEKARNQSGQ